MNPPLRVITVNTEVESILLGYMKHIHFGQALPADGKIKWLKQQHWYKLRPVSRDVLEVDL